MITLFHSHDFAEETQTDGLPFGWTTWSPRDEIAPRFGVEAAAGRNGRSAIRVDGNGNPAAVGSWCRRVDGVVGGRTHRFAAYYRTDSIPGVQRSVSARLDWFTPNGERACPPDYAMDSGTEGIWTRVEYIATAPDDAHSVVIELTLAWAATGTVWWDDILLCEEAPPPERFVRAMTVYHRPRHTKSPEENLEQFCQIIEAAPSTPDIICLPEGMAMVGTGRTYAEASESVPGPTTHCLGDLARRKQCYIVAGIYERVGSLIYNTAILIGRQGELVGTYRKTHLPREEVEGGLTPGDTHPVFQTDFGTIGILICWDMQFPEPARALALQGAEILLVPIAGGSEILTRARAIENHVFVVTSSYDMKTFIVGPTGEILAEASPEEPIAVADLPLDRKVRQPWVGDMKMRTWKERRPELPVPDFLPPYCSQSISHERRQ